MIFLFIFLALSVNASEININYRWYKYNNKSYMSLEESKEMNDILINYDNYKIVNHYKTNDINNIIGQYICINKENEAINIDDITIKYKGNKILDFNNNLIDKTIIIDLNNLYYMNDIEIDLINNGSIEISFLDNNKNTYKFNSSNKIKLYETYYNRINGNYNSQSYDDYIYKDLNDYKIMYFFYKDIITSPNTTIKDLLDTNYTFIKYTGNINYKINGQYPIHLIFEECEKDIIVKVSINDNLILEKELNQKIYEANKKNYENLVELKNKCFTELNKIIKIANQKNKEIVYLNYQFEIEKDYYKRYIKKLKYIIDEKDVEYWNTKKSSIFVGFKTLKKNYDKIKEVRGNA